MPEKDATPKAPATRRRADPPVEPDAEAAEPDPAEPPPADLAALERLRARLITQNRISQYRGRR